MPSPQSSLSSSSEAAIQKSLTLGYDVDRCGNTLATEASIVRIFENGDREPLTIGDHLSPTPYTASPSPSHLLFERVYDEETDARLIYNAPYVDYAFVGASSGFSSQCECRKVDIEVTRDIFADGAFGSDLYVGGIFHPIVAPNSDGNVVFEEITVCPEEEDISYVVNGEMSAKLEFNDAGNPFLLTPIEPAGLITLSSNIEGSASLYISVPDLRVPVGRALATAYRYSPPIYDDPSLNNNNLLYPIIENSSSADIQFRVTEYDNEATSPVTVSFNNPELSLTGDTSPIGFRLIPVDPQNMPAAIDLQIPIVQPIAIRVEQDAIYFDGLEAGAFDYILLNARSEGRRLRVYFDAQINAIPLSALAGHVDINALDALSIYFYDYSNADNFAEAMGSHFHLDEKFDLFLIGNSVFR